MTKVAVVILNYNGKKYLETYLPSVTKYSKGASIIVADNGSTDNSVPYLSKEYPEIELILFKENLGFCKGYNEALKQVDADYFVLLNSDVEVTENWIGPIISLMDKDETIKACQPKILSYQKREYFEYAGAGGGFIDILGYPFCRGRLFQTLEKDVGQYQNKCQIFWATGACLFIRSETYLGLGGLDENFFAHMEEIDLCWRINNSGGKIYYQADSTVYHLGGGTLNKSNPRKTYLNFRNGLALLYKNTLFTTLLWKLPGRLLLDMVAALKFLIFDSYKDTLAVIKADITFLYYIRKYSRKHAKKTDKYSNVIYKRLIVLDYFLMGKKVFKKLKF